MPGILTAYLARSQDFVRFAQHRPARVPALGCMGMAIYATRSPDSAAASALYDVAFAMIACGNGLFGALTCNPGRALGEVSCSIYLLHGIVPYVTFNLLIGHRRAVTLTAAGYWLVILAITPVLVALATACFAPIERPALERRTRFESFMRARAARLEAFDPVGLTRRCAEQRVVNRSSRMLRFPFPSHLVRRQHGYARHPLRPRSHAGHSQAARAAFGSRERPLV